MAEDTVLKEEEGGPPGEETVSVDLDDVLLNSINCRFVLEGDQEGVGGCQLSQGSWAESRIREEVCGDEKALAELGSRLGGAASENPYCTEEEGLGFTLHNLARRCGEGSGPGISQFGALEESESGLWGRRTVESLVQAAPVEVEGAEGGGDVVELGPARPAELEPVVAADGEELKALLPEEGEPGLILEDLSSSLALRQRIPEPVPGEAFIPVETVYVDNNTDEDRVGESLTQSLSEPSALKRTQKDPLKSVKAVGARKKRIPPPFLVSLFSEMGANFARGTQALGGHRKQGAAKID